MQLKPNLKNLLIFLLAASFFYLALLIWTAREAFPQIDLELKSIISYIVLAVEIGGHAVSKIHFENGGQLEIQNKGQMDVGRAELLTRADETSNALMLELLGRFPLLKVISEEKTSTRRHGNLDKYRADNYEVWLGMRELLGQLPSWRVPLHRIAVWIDPLDATQEYTEGLTQFVTVMACICVDGKPVVGAIHSPFKNETILGIVDHGLFSSRTGRIKIKANGQNHFSNSPNRTVLVSRSHAGNVSKLVARAFDGELPPWVVEPAGGAGYKTLRLVKQTADLYVHTTAIKKWDLCAGEAIIRAAGGALLSLSDGLPLDYSIGKMDEGIGGMKKNGDGEPMMRANEVHKGGILMALDSPFSLYERLKKHF